MTRIISLALITLVAANTAAHTYGKHDYYSYSSSSSASYKSATTPNGGGGASD